MQLYVTRSGIRIFFQSIPPPPPYFLSARFLNIFFISLHINLPSYFAFLLVFRFFPFSLHFLFFSSHFIRPNGIDWHFTPLPKGWGDSFFSKMTPALWSIQVSSTSLGGAEEEGRRLPQLYLRGNPPANRRLNAPGHHESGPKSCATATSTRPWQRNVGKRNGLC